MLSPEYLLHISEGAEEIAEQLHTEIVSRIIERMMVRIGRGDDYLLTATDKWNLDILQEAGYLLKDIQNEIAKATKLQEKEIKEAFKDAGIKALEYDDNIYREAGLSPTPLTQSPHLMRLMQRNYEATLGEWKNFTRTTAKASQQTFIRAMDKAYTLTASGAISYTQAVREAIKEVSTEGVIVAYPSGKADTIETATLRAVRTGVSQATAQIQLARMKEMGNVLAITSSHLGARPSHELWQGRIFYVDWNKMDKIYPLSEISTPSKEDEVLKAKYPDFVEATGIGEVDGLCGANCRHSFSCHYEGQNNPFEQYDSEENKKVYELSQKQRAMERRIRKTKREVMARKAAVDNATDKRVKFEFDLEYQKKAALLKKQNQAYNEFCDKNNLKRLPDRLETAKWDRQQAAEARGAAERYQSEKESLPRKGGLEQNSVDWGKVNSPQYREKFQKITSNPKIIDSLHTRAKWALYNRDGKLTEELYAVNLENGEEIARIVNQNNVSSVRRTRQFNNSLSKADVAKERVMLIHNHPNSLPPSINDINALLKHKYVSGITAGHNGNVFCYTRPQKAIEEFDYYVALRKYKEYTEFTGMKKALEDLQEKYGFIIEEL